MTCRTDPQDGSAIWSGEPVEVECEVVVTVRGKVAATNGELFAVMDLAEIRQQCEQAMIDEVIENGE